MFGLLLFLFKAWLILMAIGCLYWIGRFLLLSICHFEDDGDVQLGGWLTAFVGRVIARLAQ